MEDRICRRCQASLPAEARFCPSCGTRWQEGGGLSNAQLLMLGALALQLVAMIVMTLFVVPRMQKALQEIGGVHSSFIHFVFASWWMPLWTIVAMAIGGIATFVTRTTTARVALFGWCLAIGVLSMGATAIGMYLATIEAVNNVR